MNKYKRGDKHPTENLIFYQYHHPYYKETNGECWLSPEEFEKRRKAHDERLYSDLINVEYCEKCKKKGE